MIAVLAPCKGAGPSNRQKRQCRPLIPPTAGTACSVLQAAGRLHVTGVVFSERPDSGPLPWLAALLCHSLNFVNRGGMDLQMPDFGTDGPRRKPKKQGLAVAPRKRRAEIQAMGRAKVRERM